MNHISWQSDIGLNSFCKLVGNRCKSELACCLLLFMRLSSIVIEEAQFTKDSCIFRIISPLIGAVHEIV